MKWWGWPFLSIATLTIFISTGVLQTEWFWQVIAGIGYVLAFALFLHRSLAEAEE